MAKKNFSRDNANTPVFKILFHQWTLQNTHLLLITYFLGDTFTEYYFMLMPPAGFIGNSLSFMVSYFPFMFPHIQTR